MAEPNCKTCKHFDAAVRGDGGECLDLTKRIFVRNAVAHEASAPWVADGEIYTCLNHSPLAEHTPAPKKPVRLPMVKARMAQFGGKK